MAGEKLESIVKKYGADQVMHGIDLDVDEKEFVVLVGPSGCGKSTTLRMIAGLEEISDGQLTIDDRVMNRVALKDRDVAMVFQNNATGLRRLSSPYPSSKPRRVFNFLDDQGYDCDLYFTDADERSFKVTVPKTFDVGR